MDYFFLSTIHFGTPDSLVVSYDIACQWSRNLANRCDAYGIDVLKELSNICFLVPKFHLPAHVPICQYSFSFNFNPRVGRTDGESPERGWSATNGIASSTREMGPGSRHDTLDDHFGDNNWRKTADISE